MTTWPVFVAIVGLIFMLAGLGAWAAISALPRLRMHRDRKLTILHARIIRRRE